MHNFLYKHVSIFPLHILLTRRNDIWSKHINTFSSVSIIIVFCVEMFQYSHCTYCLREESTHFCLEVSGKFFGTKNHTKKLVIFLKIFELNQLFRHKFLYQNVSVFLLHILLQRRFDMFWSGSISTV